jgi:hypothetical protein
LLIENEPSRDMITCYVDVIAKHKQMLMIRIIDRLGSSSAVCTMDKTTSKDILPQPALSIPDGYIVIQLVDGQRCIVPEYMVPAAHKAFEGYWKRSEMDVRNESGGVSASLGQRRARQRARAHQRRRAR